MLDLSTEAFLPIAITIYVNYLKIVPDEWTIGEILGIIVSGYCILMMFDWSSAMLQYQCTGETEFEVFTDELRTRTWFQRTYYIFYLMRRLAFLTICFYLENPTYQMISLISLNLLALIVIGSENYWLIRSLRYIELGNELFTNLIFVTLYS